MLRAIDYVQLDPDTKAYLREVRRANGRGAPGVFEAKADARAAIALLAGLVVLPLFLWLGYSTNKAPWAAALIQTAGVMLGGWLIVYAVRRWTASIDRYAGRFVYFDPEHVFVGGGEEVRYARLDDATRAEPAGDTGVGFNTGGGDFVVPVPGRAVAQFVSDYYDALAHLRRTDGWWDGVTPATLGAIARYMVVNERVPVNLSEVSLEIDSMPDEVRPARHRPSGVLRYLLILAVGVGVYFAFLSTNQPLHDAGAFAAVNQTSPADLRHYLADPHTAAHHEEAKQKLAALYDKPIADVRANGTDPQTAEAFAKLLDTLRGPETPAVSLGVKDASAGAVGTSWADTLRTRLADGIGDAVGKEFVVFVRKPDDKPALLDLTYTTDGGQLVWTLEFRLTPDDEKPYHTASNTVAQATTNNSEAVYADVMKRMTGKTPAAPPAVQVGDDW